MNSVVAYSLGVAVTAGTVITGSLWYNRPGSVVRAEDMAECWAAMHERIRIANHDCSGGRYTNGVPDGLSYNSAPAYTTVVGVAGSLALYERLLHMTRLTASGYVSRSPVGAGSAPFAENIPIPAGTPGEALWASTNDVPADGAVCMSGNFVWRDISGDGSYFSWDGPYGVPPTVMTLGSRWPDNGYRLVTEDVGFYPTNDLFASCFYTGLYTPLTLGDLFEDYFGNPWAPPGFNETWWNKDMYWDGHKDVWPWGGFGTNVYLVPGAEYVYTGSVTGFRTSRIINTNALNSIKKFMNMCMTKSVLVLDDAVWGNVLFNTSSNTLEASYYARGSSSVSSNTSYSSWIEGSARAVLDFETIDGQARDEFTTTVYYPGDFDYAPDFTTLAELTHNSDIKGHEETYSENGNVREAWGALSQYTATTVRYEGVKCAWPLDYAFTQGYVSRYRVYATVYVPQAETMEIDDDILLHDRWDFTPDTSEVNMYTTDDLATGMAMPELPTGVGVNGPLAYTNLYVDVEDKSTAYKWKLLCDVSNPTVRPSFTVGTGTMPALPAVADLQAAGWSYDDDPPEAPQVGWYTTDYVRGQSEYTHYVKLHRIIVVVDWNWKHLNDANPYSPTPHTPTWMTNTNAP